VKSLQIMEKYYIHPLDFSVEHVINGLKEGRVPICPRCKSVILVASNPSEAKALGIPPGMQFSKDPNYFQAQIRLAKPESG
jgi:hypothetical protein